ncbi:MAG: NUDIX hydrolase [Candidatus Lokiarchaeota archaeon]
MEKTKKIDFFERRRYPYRPHIGVGVMMVRDNKLLLVKRKYNPDANMWSIPGGHLDLGENVENAAEREAFEETGIKVKVTKLAGIIDKIMYDDDGKIEYHYVLLNYFVNQIEGKSNQKPVADDDALDAKFVPFEELKDYNLTKSLVKLLEDLKIGYD